MEILEIHVYFWRW